MANETPGITPNQQTYNNLQINDKDSKGDKASKTELIATLDSTYASGSISIVNGTNKQTDAVG